MGGGVGFVVFWEWKIFFEGEAEGARRTRVRSWFLCDIPGSGTWSRCVSGSNLLLEIRLERGGIWDSGPCETGGLRHPCGAPLHGGVGSSASRPRTIWFIAEVRSHQDLRQQER
jgi:hypothetical protein